MKKRVRILYSGMVQGVGFRFTAERVANELGVNGWVKNMRDGRVEIVAEAEEGVLDEFARRLQSGSLKRYIQHADVSRSEATGEFHNFEIRFL